MNYYTVSKPSPTYYTKALAALTSYIVSNPTTTYYGAGMIAIRTWLSLANQGATTWAKLKELGLTTWKRLGAARAGVTFYYSVSNPTTTYYEVT